MFSVICESIFFQPQEKLFLNFFSCLQNIHLLLIFMKPIRSGLAFKFCNFIQFGLVLNLLLSDLNEARLLAFSLNIKQLGS